MTYKIFSDYDFIKESNKIEGIQRPPTKEEKAEFNRFMKLDMIDVADLQQFVSVYQSNAVLRNLAGYDVRVGNYIAPKGGMSVVYRLNDILHEANNYRHTKINTYEVHKAYEKLHPFTDGNGRSGRMLWRWMMREAPLGFLHHWYYQCLEFERHEPEY